MKILSYNINQCSQEKLNAVINMGADIMLLFECANKPLISIPDDYEMLWSGDTVSKSVSRLSSKKGPSKFGQS